MTFQLLSVPCIFQNPGYRGRFIINTGVQRAGANQQIVAGVKINGINGGIAAQDAADLFQIITKEKDAVNISFAAGVRPGFLPGISIAEKVDGPCRLRPESVSIRC